MGDVTETVTESWGERILDSIKGVIIGILLFFGSFVLLFWNEGRVNVTNIAKKATHISSTSEAPQNLDMKLISTTGNLETKQEIGDTYLKPSSYIELNRNAEMFAWVEHVETDSKKEMGGSKKTKRTYIYKKEWVDAPTDSSNFKEVKGHKNPKMTIVDKTNLSNQTNIGVYSLNTPNIELPDATNITLDKNNTKLKEGMGLANSEYIYKGSGTLESPQVGDIRVSYSVVRPRENATVFGQLNLADKKISPHYGKENTKLYRLFFKSRDAALATMQNEYETTTWMLRGAGFAMMWFGLFLILGPIGIFLDVVPFVGSLGKLGIAIVTMLASLVLSGVTILISAILHNIWVLLAAVAVLIGAGIWYVNHRKKSKKKQA